MVTLLVRVIQLVVEYDEETKEFRASTSDGFERADEFGGMAITKVLKDTQEVLQAELTQAEFSQGLR